VALKRLRAVVDAHEGQGLREGGREGGREGKGGRCVNEWMKYR